MATEKDGGPAFPTKAMTAVSLLDGKAMDVEVHTSGMTLRDYFAGQALGQLGITIGNFDGRRDAEGISNLASYAYTIANALLAERERQS